MANIRLMTAKDGREFYKVEAYRNGRRVCKRWYIPEGWSQKKIERDLARFAADLERGLETGELRTFKEKIEDEAQAKAEAAKIRTFKQYADGVFLPALKIRASGNTISSYDRHLTKDIYPAIGARPLPEITSAEITRFLLAYQTGGTKGARAHATVIKVYTILSGIFKAAYLDETIKQNPMERVQRPRPRKSEMKGTGPECLTLEETRATFEALKTEPLKWRVYVNLLLFTGIRRGEACGLHWDCVDFRNQRITIRRSLNATTERGIFEETPKSGRERTLDVEPQVMELLRELRLDQMASVPSQYVFTQEKSAEPMYPTSPTRYLKEFSKRHGLAPIHPHELRHTYASLAITAGADVVSVSENLGHADTAITLRTYSHANEESRKRASQIFAETVAAR